MNGHSIHSVNENKQLFKSSISQPTQMNIFEDLSFSNGTDRWSFDSSVSFHGCEYLKSHCSYKNDSHSLNSPLRSTRCADRDSTDDSSGTESHSLSPPDGDVNARTDRPGKFLMIKNATDAYQEDVANAPFEDNFFTPYNHASDVRAVTSTAKFVFDNNYNSPSCQDFSTINGVSPHCEMMMPAIQSFPVTGNWSYPPITAPHQHQMYSNTPVSSPTQNYYTSNQYRSFVSELCSPDLPSAEDVGIQYDLPISLGLEDCGFDKFLQPIPFETSDDIRNDTLLKNKESIFQKKSTNLISGCLQALLFEDVHQPNSLNNEEAVCCFPLKQDSRISKETNYSFATPYIHQAIPRDELHTDHTRHQTNHGICGSLQNSFQDGTPNTREINPTYVTRPGADHQLCAHWHQGSPYGSSWQPKPFCGPAQGDGHDFESVLSVSGPETELLRNGWHGSYNVSTPNCENALHKNGRYPSIDPDLRHTCTPNPLLTDLVSDVDGNRDQSEQCPGHRALLTFMQEHASSKQNEVKNISNNIVAFSMDHIMQNRPPANLLPTAREILNDSFKQATALLHETFCDECDKLSGGATDKDNDGADPPKKRRATDVKSEDSMPGQWSVSMNAMSVGSPPSHEGAGCHRDPSPNTPPTDSRGSPLSSSLSSKTEIRRPSVLPPCRVCTSKASGLHYGVVTCEACNGFFRRSLKRRAIYLCSKDRRCDVKGKKRGECSYCRYQTCLAVGMSKNAVKTGRYSDKTRLAYAIETDNQNKNNPPVEDFSRLDTTTSDLIKLQDQHVQPPGRVPDHQQFEKQCKCSKLYSSQAHSIDSATRTTTHSKDIPGVTGVRTPADTSDAGFSKIRAGFLENWLHHFAKFVQRIPGFNLLHLNDQASLVRSTWHEIWLLGAHRGFNSEIKVTVSPNGTANSNGTANPNGTVAHDDEIKMVYGEVYADLSYKLSNQLKKLKVTPEEIVLIKMMCLTYPDRHRLENPDQVRSLHWLVTQCLRRELEKTHPDEPGVFSEIVACVVDLRAALHNSLLPGKGPMYTHSLNSVTPLLKELLRDSEHH